MHKRTIKYTDYNDESQERDFYFNLSKTEIAKLEASTKGGLEYKLNKIMVEKDVDAIMTTADEIIMLAYGEKSVDGRFVKSKELSKAFSETAAYDELFMELLSDADKFAAFITAIIPKTAELPKTN